MASYCTTYQFYLAHDVDLRQPCEGKSAFGRACIPGTLVPFRKVLSCRDHSFHLVYIIHNLLSAS